MEAILLLVLAGAGVWLFGTACGSTAAPPAPRQVPPRARRPAGRPAAARFSTQFDSSLPAPSLQEAIQESERSWRGPGSALEVQGYAIPDGMLYVGRGLRALRGWSLDPALVDPSLPVDPANVDRTGITMGYWPSYTEIPPSARAGYLEWLHLGRRDPSAYIGYVFLFFYGLERRLLLDTRGIETAREEVPLLQEEVRTLLEIYGSNNSFRGYATGFLDLVDIAQGRIDPETAKPEGTTLGWEVTARTKFVLGSLVARGRPIPPEWALAWWRQSSHSVARTAVTRCPEEFEKLFVIRYRQEFGDGMTVKPNRTLLHIAYRPGSATFSGMAEIELDGIPDVTALKRPVTRLQQFADGVCQELDGFSRWVGRHADRNSPAAVALLPAELAREAVGEVARGILDWLEGRLGADDVTVLKSPDLISRWSASSAGRLSKKEASTLAEFLGHFELGIEPDVRFGGRNPTSLSHIAVFRSPEASLPPGKDYAPAAVLLRIGAAVATADDTVTREEEEHLERHLEDALHLEPHARARLRARLRWLLSEPPSLAGLAKKVEQLAENQRRGAARFLLSLAGADGHVSPPELKILSKMYRLFGLDPEMVYADVHALAAGGDVDLRDGPVTVIQGETAPGIAIPSAPPEGDIVLDQSRIDSIRKETMEVGRMLEGVFVDAEDDAEGEADASDSSIEGLDAAHANLVHALLTQPEWPRVAFDRLAEEHGLMPAGALETINDFAFDLADEPLLEGDDPLELNPHAAEEVRK